MTIDFSPPDITEREIAEVVATLKSGWITTGPRTKHFERVIAEYCGVDQAVCLNSATAAMELVLRMFGIGPGDEVITSAYTYSASAAVIDHVGAKIVLCDVRPNSTKMDLEQLDSLITDKTKAIIPVDVGGVIEDLDGILEIVKKHQAKFKPNHTLQEKLGRIMILCDAAHSFGATDKGRLSGTIADFTTFSFHAVKNLTTGEGGALVWQPIPDCSDEDVYKHIMLYALHGQSKDALSKLKPGMWEYDILFPGYKCNMTDITAAIGLIQFNRYPELLKRRKEIVARYDAGFKGSKISVMPHQGADFESCRHLYLTRVEGIDEARRNEIILALADKGISTNVHYKPLPMFTAYKNLGFDIKDFPNSFDYYRNLITLPLHTHLTDDQIDYIIEEYKKLVE